MSSLYLMTDVDRVRIGLLVFSLLMFAFSVPIALPMCSPSAQNVSSVGDILFSLPSDV